ncbi:hypothetical protein C7402_102482 [Paraburkholderia unamae]|uniref:Uncharacterized protein n=2 Tax=Paraburkholderia unamae TaxID=219649 RepID=A0ABX5KWX0_9BURK|nr:hypothetical protein C7402_102482 [Paraburkholderia unamae]RAR67862.1 hypothetical protein C7401_101100 [Paraburkholderia unamae]
MTLGEALEHAELLEAYGVISRTAQALILMRREYRNVVGVEQYELIFAEAGLVHPDPQ